MTELKFICINKDNGNHDNPNEAITYYGWIENGHPRKTDRATMVKWVEEDQVKPYVVDSDGNKAYCYVRTSPHGTKFLQTYSDGEFDNNLLNLPECK